MNLKSITNRLALWFFFCFMIGMIIVLSCFYYLTRFTLLTQTDKEISVHSQEIVRIIDRDDFGLGSAVFQNNPGMLVVVYDKDGAIVTTTQGIKTNKQLESIYFKFNNIKESTFIDDKIGKTQMRLKLIPLGKSLDDRRLVVVGHPVDNIQHSLNDLTLKVFILMLIIGISGFFFSLFIARRVIYPVTNLSSRIKQLSLHNIKELIIFPRTGDELEELANSFNSLMIRLSHSFERERQFIGDVAHELKTPLTTLKNTIEVTLSSKRDIDHYKSVLVNTLSEINNLSGTVNDVLDLAWVESGEALSKIDEFNLSELLKELDEVSRNLAQEKNIRVIEDIKPNIKIRGNRQKLFRALFNIVENAIKYSPQKSRIALTLEVEKKNIHIEVSNTGPGISQSELPKIFNRFYRGSTQSQSLGSGLGLSIAKSIIEVHGGQVIVTSIPNKITTCKIILPVVSS